VDCEPLVALPPDQAPEAVQLVELELLHVSVELFPLVSEAGFADSETTGAACETTLTVVDFDLVPPLPVHDNLNVLLLARGPVDCEPLVALLPDHAPEAVQLVAFVLLHASVELPPLGTDAGFALRETLGARELTLTVTVRETPPPVPEQVSVYFALVVSVAVCREPLVGMLPDQAPEAVHAVASVLDQERVLLLPLAILAGAAFRARVGGGVPPVELHSADLICHPSPPPTASLQALGSEPATAP
jgi:hypothetical protein